MVTAVSFGSWLERKLELRGWKPIDLARALQTSTGVISNWINNSRVPSPKSCDKIADALFLDVDEVLAAAGHRPMDVTIDPESPTAQLMPLIERVKWDRYPDRLESLKFELRWLIERDRDQG